MAKPSPEFMMRVKLPYSGVYASDPKGDSEHHTEWLADQEALFDALPEGFEICYERTGHTWPVDSQGFTYVRIRPERVDAIQNEYYRLQKENRALLERMKKIRELL